MNNPSPPLSPLLTPFPLMGLTLALFIHVDRQKASGPPGGACLTKPAYWHSSSASFLFFLFSLRGSSDRAGQLWSKNLPAEFN